MKKVFLTLLLLTPISVCVYADNKYIEQKIIQEACGKDTIFKSAYIDIELPISVLQSNRINKHIGFSLFSTETKNLTNSEICNFIERLFLKLYLVENKKAEIEYLNAQDILLQINNTIYAKSTITKFNEVLNSFSMPSEFFIHKDNDKFYVSFLYNGDNLLELVFPASKELISGLDKKELDNEVSYLLSEQIDDFTQNEFHIITDSSILTEYKDGIYVKKGTIYYTDKLSNDTYYTIGEDNIYYPILTSEYPIQSLSNILLGLTKQSPQIHVKHRMYGNFTPDFKIRLNKMLQCFNDGFNLYVGVQKLDNNQIQGVLVFHNHIFNYIHMLIIKMNKSDIDNIEDTILKADFYSNIPQHNIKNLITL